jgi:phosphoserine aminotransferase
MIIDPNSNGETILDFVSELLSKLDQLQEKAIIYKNYQKNFKASKLHYTHQP